MIPRYAPLKRSAPPRKRRSKPRRGQPTKAEKTAIRLAVYERAGGRCELKLLTGCIQGVLPFDGDTPWDHGHLVHIHAKRRFGTSVEGCLWGCHVCHLNGMHLKGLKPA